MTKQTVIAATLAATLGCGSGSTRAFNDKPAATSAARIEQLAGLFDFEKDGDTGEGWYSVKDPIAGSLVRKRIEPFIHSSGRISLRSVFRNEDWIYHDQIVVRIADTEIASERIPGTDRRNTRRVTQKEEYDQRNDRRVTRKRYISETILFTNGSDNGILAAIARDPSQPVELRFAGRELSHSETMSDDDKRRIAAGVELARLLRERQGAKP
ncbi:MAG TPA: hypothetical protein VM076_07945 [Gemmatimonadaceae bacterium]|nr:hypothetical protein [Gemmatimonadaceae bacterium]